MFRFALHATRKMSRFVSTVLSSVISMRSWNINVEMRAISSRYKKEYRKLLQPGNYVSLGFDSSARTFAKAIRDDRACSESSRVPKYRIINSTFLVACGFFVNRFI